LKKYPNFEAFGIYEGIKEVEVTHEFEEA